MIKPRNWREWANVVVVALIVVSVVLGPFYAVGETREEAARIIAEIDYNAQLGTQRAIAINAYTIACLAELPEDSVVAEQLGQCIREGLVLAEASNPVPRPVQPLGD